MGWASWLNPVQVVKNTYHTLENIGDDQLGLGNDRNRGLYDPFGAKQAKDEAKQAADEARAAEEAKQAEIMAGERRVGDTFAQFNQPYYDSIAKAYLDYYKPLLEEQFNRAKRNLTLSAPSTGSSAFARTLGELSRDFSRESVGLADRAQEAALSKQMEVENQKQTILDSVRGGLGVEAAGDLSALRARLLSPPSTYQALPDLFSRYALSAGNAVRAQAAGYSVPRPLIFGGAGYGRNISTVD